MCSTVRCWVTSFDLQGIDGLVSILRHERHELSQAQHNMKGCLISIRMSIWFECNRKYALMQCTTYKHLHSSCLLTKIISICLIVCAQWELAHRMQELQCRESERCDWQAEQRIKRRWISCYRRYLRWLYLIITGYRNGYIVYESEDLVVIVYINLYF